MYHGVTQKGKRTVEAAEPEKEESVRDDKKERVLHTRVPAVLEAELKRFAQNLRVPVSNLVRTILEDALEVADAAGDRVEERLRNAATQLQTERERLRRKIRPDPLSDVYAFQPVTLAQPAHCAKCDVALAVGDEANLGLLDPNVEGNVRIFVCDDCVPKKEKEKES
jgi:hypothetical protein